MFSSMNLRQPSTGALSGEYGENKTDHWDYFTQTTEVHRRYSGRKPPSFMLSFHYQQFNWQPKRHFRPDQALCSEKNMDQVSQILDDAWTAESCIC